MYSIYFATYYNKIVSQIAIRDTKTFFQAKNFDNLWEVHVRRGVLLKILEEWINVYRDDAVVDGLLEALSTPGFMDVKLRDAIQNKERFLKTSCIRYIQLNPIKLQIYSMNGTNPQS